MVCVSLTFQVIVSDLLSTYCILTNSGLGDLNQSRTAATNATRRKAEFEVIVAKSERVTTEDVVDHQIKQSIKVHGAKNTVLVLTKIDVSTQSLCASYC
jgi:hypothetical protein